MSESNGRDQVAQVTYREALASTMRDALALSERTIIVGQGVNDHKGTFGTTLGLHEEFGADRVVDSPLAEEGLTGICVGMALGGLYPIQVHIRADFALLAMNQLVNLAAKYKYMFGGRFSVPMMVRMIIGRSWGQGAQHSQSLQSLFAHIPGLTVLMPSSAGSILANYPAAIASCDGPVISLEHRLMYDLQWDRRRVQEDLSRKPLSAAVVRPGNDVTVVATSIMVLEALRAADHLAQHGLDVEVIDLNCVSHIDRGMVMDSLRKTGHLLVADTSWRAYGVSAEICRVVCEEGPQFLKAPVETMGMAPASCPTAKALEDLYYPNLTTLSHRICALVKGTEHHGITVPSEASMADVYKKFKGPF